MADPALSFPDLGAGLNALSDVVIHGQRVIHNADGSWQVGPAPSPPKGDLGAAGSASAGPTAPLVEVQPQASSDPESLIRASAQKYGVDPALAVAIAQHGEGFGKYTDPSAKSPKGATGVMQVMPGTAPGVDLTDPAQNVDAGVQYLKQLSDKYHGDSKLIAAAYNAGPGAVDSHGGVPPYPETQAYVQRVSGALDSGAALPVSQAAIDAAFAGASGDATPKVGGVSQAAIDAAFGDDKPGQPGNPPPQAPSAGTEIGAGAIEGLTGLPDALKGALGMNLGGQISRAGLLNDPKFIAAAKARGVTPDQLADAMAGPTFGHLLNKGLGLVGLNPENVPAPTPTSRVERGVGAGMSSALLPGGDLVAGGRVLGVGAKAVMNALAGGAIGGGAQAASEFAPDGAKPVVGMATGLALGLGLHGAGAAGRGALRGAEPFAAFASPKAAQKAAFRQIMEAASNPQAVRSALSGGKDELVPGSVGTVGQISGDMGVLSKERAIQTANPEVFNNRRGEQNIARRNALAGIQQNGDVTALPAGLKANEQAARSAENAAWTKARDMAKGVSWNVQASKAGAQAILDEQLPESPALKKNERRALDAAVNMPDMATGSRLIALRQNVNALIRGEKGMRTPTYARMSQLLKAIDDNLDNSIGTKIEPNAAEVAKSAAQADNSPAAKLQSILQEARRAGQSVAFGSGEGGPRPAPPGRANVDAGDLRAEIPPGGQPGNGPGPETVSGIPGDEAARGQLAAANAATKARAQTFGPKPVQDVGALTEPTAITRKVGTILGGDNGVVGMRALMKATKGDPDAVTGLRQAVADHIAERLVSNTEVGASGAAGLKADQFQTFLRRNRSALGEVLNPDELARLDAIGADLQRANRSLNAVKIPGQSNTAQDNNAMRLFLQHGPRAGLDIAATILGTSAHGAMGGVAAGAASEALQFLRQKGVNNINDAMREAVMNPAFFREMMTKFPDTAAGRQNALVRLAGSLGRAGAAASLSAGAQKTTPIPLSQSQRVQPNALAGAF